MQRFRLGVALAVGLACAACAAPTEIWKVTGFDAPESVALDPAAKVLYVSNVAGSVMEKDGNGFIAKVSPEGKMLERNWLTGLNGPTGLTITNGKLYAADIDELVEIDIASAKVLNRYPASGAKFLNDVTSDSGGTVYASDVATNTIWRLKDGSFAPWLQSDDLNGPNGLVIDANRLIVASFGKEPTDNKDGKPGTLLAISLDDKSLTKAAGGVAIGNLDGLALVSPDTYLATDWPKGALYRISAEGSVEELKDLNQGSADIAYLPSEKIVLIPMMKDNALIAYRLD